MNLLLSPASLRGKIVPPPSKSQAHRLIIAAALADGVSRIAHVAASEDMKATVRCMEALGAQFSWAGDVLKVTGLFTGGAQPKFDVLPRLDCGESGSTLRFLIPIALAVAGGGVFTGRGRLMERPQKPYFDLFREKGVSCFQENGVLTVFGRLSPGDYRLPGNVSSQFFTGLLYALPLLDAPSRVISTTPLESADYLVMTREVLRFAGAPISECRNFNGAWNDWTVAPFHPYVPMEREVEADWSQAGFFIAANGLGNHVELRGMNAHSAQGDRIIESYAAQLTEPGELELDVSQCPDLVPALALLAALRAGETTRITGAARLRLKESDRLETVAAELSELGGNIVQGADFLLIHGVSVLHGGTVRSHNDHRIAMMLAMAATRCDGPVKLLGSGCVSKSYPDFWKDYVDLGGRIEEVP